MNTIAPPKHPTIGQQGLKARLNRAQAMVRKRGFDSLLVNSNEADFANVRYVTDYWPIFETAGVPILPARDQPTDAPQAPAWRHAAVEPVSAGVRLFVRRWRAGVSRADDAASARACGLRLKAHNQTIQWMRSGVVTSEVARKYRRFFDDRGYGAQFLYGPAHGLGMIEVVAAQQLVTMSCSVFVWQSRRWAADESRVGRVRQLQRSLTSE